MSPRAEVDPRLRASIMAVAGVGATLSAAALAFFGPTTALSVTVGAAVSTANLWALGRIVSALLPSESDAAQTQSRAGWALVALVKMFGLVAVVWLLMKHGVVSPVPMLVGLGALPMGVVVGSLASDAGARQGKRGASPPPLGPGDKPL
jgi:hypothetical protein